MKNTPTEVQEALQRSFDERLDRLARLHALNAPATIICSALVLVIKAAVLLYRTTFWESLHASIAGWFMVGMGFCPECRGDYRAFPVCPECLDKAAEDEDLILDLLRKDEG